MSQSPSLGLFCSLDEQLVIYGRTGVMPTKVETEEASSQDVAKELPQTSKAKPRPKPIYQLSLDAGLLAASSEETSEKRRWRSHRQMTFDTDDTKHDQLYLKSSVGEKSQSSIITPFSASELNVNLPGVSFIKQSRSTQNLNGKVKKVIDENDLSSHYNQYKCLSPSDPHQTSKSSRFLKRQFSMDKEETTEKNVRLFKQNSAGAANDLGRIDEVPLQQSVSSPKFGKNSNYKHRTIPSKGSSESLN